MSAATGKKRSKRGFAIDARRLELMQVEVSTTGTPRRSRIQGFVAIKRLIDTSIYNAHYAAGAGNKALLRLDIGGEREHRIWRTCPGSSLKRP